MSRIMAVPAAVMGGAEMRDAQVSAPAPNVTAATATPSVAAAATTSSASSATPSLAGERQVRCAECCPENHSEDAEADADS